MRILAIETATKRAGVAAFVEGKIIASRAATGGHNHAVLVPAQIEAVLGESGLAFGDFDALAVSAGPGSFTGLRVGYSLALGISLASNVRLVTVPTMEVLARSSTVRFGTIATVLDARRGEVYAARYRRASDDLTCIDQPSVHTVAQLRPWLDGAIAVGEDGIPGFAVEEVVFPEAAVLARVAAERIRQGAETAGDADFPVYVANPTIRCADHKVRPLADKN